MRSSWAMGATHCCFSSGYSGSRGGGGGRRKEEGRRRENEEEEEQCKDAMEGCPVEAIGNFGAD